LFREKSQKTETESHKENTKRWVGREGERVKKRESEKRESEKERE
jgi:hypothetical protein